MTFRVGDRVRFVRGPGASLWPDEVFVVGSGPQQCPATPTCVEPVYQLVGALMAHGNFLELVPPDDRTDFIPPAVRKIFEPKPVKERA